MRERFSTFRTLHYDGVFNHARLANFAVEQLSSEYFFFITDDTRILTPRIYHPMIRRTKGADLERVSWDEALDFTASKMQAIIDEYGPNAVMTTGSSRGGGNEANYVMQKFTRACIGTHSVDNCART